jgi:hypothetical protein
MCLGTAALGATASAEGWLCCREVLTFCCSAGGEVGRGRCCYKEEREGSTRGGSGSAVDRSLQPRPKLE